MNRFSLIALPLLGSVAAAAEMQVHRDLSYAEPKSERRMLDVYAPQGGKSRPVVVWIHGGGWHMGDKRSVQDKPQAFVDRGYVFVAINYRFVPQVTVEEMAGDVGQAVGWIHRYVADYGGNRDALFVMGHSAGAHLAALICTDDRYLKAAGVSPSIVKGCVPVDTAVYDIATRLAATEGRLPESYKSTFGDDPTMHRRLSPVTYVAKGKSIPPFLILHVASRPDSKAQSQLFAQALEAADVSAAVVAAEGKNHGTINSDLGKPDDPPTQEVFRFVEKLLPQ